MRFLFVRVCVCLLPMFLFRVFNLAVFNVVGPWSGF